MATANDRLRDRLDSIYSGSLIFAVLVHLLVFHFSPTFVAADWSPNRGGAKVEMVPPIVDLPDAPDAAPNSRREDSSDRGRNRVPAIDVAVGLDELVDLGAVEDFTFIVGKRVVNRGNHVVAD